MIVAAETSYSVVTTIVVETLPKTSSRINASLLLKIDSLRTRARLLISLRKMLSLQPHQDISAEQWEVLESQLSTVSNKIRQQLRLYTDKYFSERNDPLIRQTLVNRLGELEVELTTAYGFYDTFMDILTQRLSNDIGPLLRGCDAIAAHALQRGNISDITVPPLVYCDRGFGASVLREGVRINQNTPNPIPVIAIPYSRINEKYNLISIFHEAGHQAVVKLNMVELWQQVLYEALKKAGATPLLCNLYANWSKEIVPDFWAFCLSGMAQTCSVRDVLILPASMMFSVSTIQPHPPSYLRFLLSTDWCRQLWGHGDWDAWEEEWVRLYPLGGLDETTRQLIKEARQCIPVVSKALLMTRFRKLGNKPITTLFALNTLAPSTLKSMATMPGTSTDQFKKQPIGVQLAVFRLMREKRTVRQADIDQRMDEWLKNLVQK
ncbi:hypothetical protein ACFSUS_00390 [Spirosoma soli]|uniref:Uncharacterized protein n=1 Tax=Spirosoma soli TaxID=1770529 RepID=A0ABW5LYD1_9BACT